jgi:hypothetical protein
MEHLDSKHISRKHLSKWFLAIAMVFFLCLCAMRSRVYSAGQASTAIDFTTDQPITGQLNATNPPSKMAFDFKRYTGNRPFTLNTLPTTPYGPPWADVMLQPSNMLECKRKSAPIALCYYSGPGPTAPCTADGLGLANCTCYEIPAGETYFVDINAILNRDVYLKTVAVCHKDGSRCAPTTRLEAPVCRDIDNNTLIPGADLISTFSLYLEKKSKEYPQFAINPTNCPTAAAYAGCMTAPCKRTGKTDPTTGLALVQCGCPVYTGPYQVGQIANDQCVLGGNYVWSAAYIPSPSPTPGG